MHFRKNCWKLFSPSSNFQAYNPKKNLIFGEKRHPNVLCTQNKWKTELFFGEFFSKAERFPPKKENEKAFSLGKDTKFFFCAPIQLFWEKNWSFFPKNWHRKAQVPHKNSEESRKNQDAVFPVLNALSKALLKTFLANREKFGSQSKTTITFWGKTSPKNLLRTKIEKLGLLSKTFQS